MNRRFVLLAGLVLAAGVSASRAENWPGFRGPRGDGSCTEAGLPTNWSATTNVAWSVELPGRGHSSPVVWNDRIFVTTALAETQERVLLCLDRKTGRTLWQKTVLKSPLEHIHELNSYASSTPLTDGERVYISFLDRDQIFLAAYDFQGNLVWEARPGPFHSQHGYSSSPILWKDRIIVNGDHDGPGFVVSLKRKTGDVVWKIDRPNQTRSYCTPLIRDVNGTPHMMMTGSKCVASYNPDTGALQWLMDGPTEQFVAAPVFNGKLLFITAGFPEKHVLAIDPTGSGKVGDEHIVWRTRRGCSYVPSPLMMGDYLLVVSDGGFVTCYQAGTGEILWTQRLSGGHSASPISAGGLAYFQSDRGVTTILKAGKTCEVVAENQIGEDTFASPVASQGQLFLRGVKHLFAIGTAR